MEEGNQGTKPTSNEHDNFENELKEAKERTAREKGAYTEQNFLTGSSELMAAKHDMLKQASQNIEQVREKNNALNQLEVA